MIEDKKTDLQFSSAAHPPLAKTSQLIELLSF